MCIRDRYKDYAVLEKVYLGDVVTVTNKKMNFSKKAKVISYEYDAMLKRYKMCISDRDWGKSPSPH